MSLSELNPYLDVVMQHLSDLMVDAASWPEAMQDHLYSFWATFDQMLTVLPLPQPPAREIRACLSEMWCKLEALEQIIFEGDIFWHLSMLRKTLIYITRIIDGFLCHQLEYPAAYLTSRLQAS